MTRIDPLTGQILSAFDGPDAFSGTTFDLRSDGTNVVMAWSWSGELRVAQIGMTTVVNQKTLTSPQEEGFAPSLAWSGTQWLVAFHNSISEDLHSGTQAEGSFAHHVYAMRLSPALAVLDPHPIELGIEDVTFATGSYGSEAHAASIGGDFIVAMTHDESQTVLLRRVFANGSIAPDVQRLGAGIALDIVADHGRYAVAIASPTKPFGFQQFVTYVDRNGVASSRDAFPLGFSVWTGMRAQLAVGLDGIVAAYQRTAYEPLYGGVERVFLRSSSSEGRGRAARRCDDRILSATALESGAMTTITEPQTQPAREARRRTRPPVRQLHVLQDRSLLAARERRGEGGGEARVRGDRPAATPGR